MFEIRDARPHDGAGIHEIYAPVITGTAITFEFEVPTVEELARRVASVQERHPWLVAADDDGILGYAYATEFRQRAAYRWTVELAVYIHPDRRRGGVGRALYAALFRCLEVQGFQTLIAGITLPNVASVALHEGMGFIPVGVFEAVGFKFGRWHDVGFWQRSVAAERATPTADPRPAASLMGSAAWRAALRPPS